MFLDHELDLAIDNKACRDCPSCGAQSYMERCPLCGTEMSRLAKAIADGTDWAEIERSLFGEKVVGD